MSTQISNSPQHVFLTGATGVLGGRILQEILSSSSANVYCLVRAKSMTEARQRLEAMLFSYDREQVLQPQLDRIVPLLGDVSKARFALAPADYKELQDVVDRTIHCAANVSLVASYGKVSPVNVTGTEHVIDFCVGGRIPLLYSSSFSVVGNKLYHEFELQETDLEFGQTYPDMNYERSKYEAEKAVHRASERGLIWSIARPGNIWGDSQHGRYPLLQTRVKGIYYEMIKSLIETGYTFQSSEDFDITPVDYVAKACWHACLNIHDFDGKTLHLIHPNPITYDDIVVMLRDYGYQVRNMASEDYFEALSQSRILRQGKPYRSVFTDLMALFHNDADLDEKAKYATQMTRDALAGSGIECPPCDQKLLFRYFQFLIDEGFVCSPQMQTELAQIQTNFSRPSSFLEHLFEADL